MKKLIIAGLLMPFIGLAASVSITDVSPYTGGFSATGGASGDSLSISLENGVNLWGGSVGAWNVDTQTTSGEHTLTATASDEGGSVSASQTFIVPSRGSVNPCQIDGTCPNFGIFAPRVDMNAVAPTWRYVNPGQEGCPAFFTMRCIIR